MSDILNRIDSLISDLQQPLSCQDQKHEEEELQAKEDVIIEQKEGSIDEKMHYITRNLEEIMNPDESLRKMREIIAKRPLKIYWGTATTGAPHIAYFIPLTKLGDFLKAGCEVTILLADLHAFLDAQKTPQELLAARVKYYKAIISSMLRAVGVPLEKLKFVQGLDFQLTPEYTLDVYRLCAKTSINAGKRAGAEVVKQAENPEIAPVIYPLLQALDEHYLGVDCQFGGVDQRKIFAYASDFLKKVLGYPSRMHLMNPICPGLTGDKMSSSEAKSKIDPLDDAKLVQKKISGAFCEAGNVEKNGVLSFCKFVVFPCFLDGKPFIVERRDAEPLVFHEYEHLKAAFAAKEVHPGDLKDATTKALNKVLDRVRADFENPEYQELRAKAYPTKKKNEVDLGDNGRWITDFFAANEKWPTLKEIRNGCSLSKRDAKRLLAQVQKQAK